MIVGVPRESFPGERRVALVPAALANLAKAGLEVVVETGAGAEAGYPDSEYVAKGAKITPDRAEAFSGNTNDHRGSSDTMPRPIKKPRSKNVNRAASYING